MAKLKFSKSIKSCFFVGTFSLLGYFSTNVLASESEDEASDDYSKRLLIVGKKTTLETEAGAVSIIDEEQLEKFEYDDIHQILAQVPGVNIRQEDGYGLRPNIGFRGVTPERSKKINILEDGVLIGPAPYSAPAAYYFPMVSRLSSIEVFKGPSAILYGPNTVAGTLNLNTRQVSNNDEGMIDLSVGSDDYQKLHAYAIENSGNLGFLIEGLKVKAGGFKELANGDDTGFDKSDITSKIRYDYSANDLDHVFELKLGYAEEQSDETYLGLTDDDFQDSPYQRYAATQLGLMKWEHQQFQFNHFVSGDGFDITTRAYRNNFERAWRKLNNFSGTSISLQEILQDPEGDVSSVFYDILVGNSDSEVQFGKLLIGTNDRSFYSQGLQSDVRWDVDWLGMQSTVKGGIRYHEDQIERNHTEELYNMVSAELVAAGDDILLRTANTEQSKVWSVYLQNTFELNQWELSFGLRGEHIDSYYQNNLEGLEEDWLEKSALIWLPGASAFYSLNQNSGVFAGVHRGFIPTSPKQAPEIDIEDSINLELGYRYLKNGTQIEFVGFSSKFENLKESCTASTSSRCFDNLDQEFNAGNVDVWGLESSISFRTVLNSTFELPWSIIHTYTNAEFQESFNSDFELWGNVTKGDEVPYLPANQLTLTVGLNSVNWQTNLLARYIDEMKEAAGSEVSLSGATTEKSWVVDLSSSYEFANMGTLYFKIDNLLDEVNVVSRRPFGARPNKPRQFYLGYKYRW